MLASSAVSTAGTSAELAAQGPKLQRLARIDDPRYDDKGPGTYIYPTSRWFERGQFDLRALEVLKGEGIVTFRITLDHQIQRPDAILTSGNVKLNLENNIYFQNIDIYVDHTPGVGETQGIPGRNIRFDRREAWDFALVITPQPYAVRSVIDDWPPHTKVLVSDVVQSHGRQIWVHVPEMAIGRPLGPDTGYQVAISGALFQNNFEVFRLATDRFIKNAFTMPVFSVTEQMAFGGGVLSRWQPRTIDILVPDQANQFSILKKFDHDTATLARVPMVYPSGKRPATASSTTDSSTTTEAGQAPALPTLSYSGEIADEVRSDGMVVASIRDVHEQMAILKRPNADVPLYRLGVVHNLDGDIVGRVVVTAVFAEFIQTTIVEGRGKIRRGHQVRFEPLRSK